MSDLLPGLREKISDAAYEYQQYIDTDHAHINLTAYMEQAFDNALRELERAQNAGAEPAIIQNGPIAHSVPLYEEPATKAAGQENTADRSQGSVFSRSGLRAGGCPNEPAPAATVPLSATEREVMRKARAAASRIVSRIAAAPQITDAPGVAQVETTAERVAPASSVPLTEEEIEQVYEDARDYWLNDSEARGEMRELGIPPEDDAVVKCDMNPLRALCDLALAGLRARDEALEEAAKRVEREFVGHYLGNTAAHLIRALKGTP